MLILSFNSLIIILISQFTNLIMIVIDLITQE